MQRSRKDWSKFQMNGKLVHHVKLIPGFSLSSYHHTSYLLLLVYCLLSLLSSLRWRDWSKWPSMINLLSFQSSPICSQPAVSFSAAAPLHNGASNEIKEIKFCKECPKVKPYCAPIFYPILFKPFFGWCIIAQIFCQMFFFVKYWVNFLD